MEPVSKYKLLFTLVFVFGIITGLLEGVSVGMIALSVMAITSQETECMTQIANVVDFLGLSYCDPYDRNQMFIILLLLGAVLQVLKGGVQYLTTYMSAHLQSRVVYYLQKRTTSHLMSLHIQDMGRLSMGEKQSLIRYSSSANSIIDVLKSIIIATFTFLSYFVLLVTMSWELSIFSAVILVFLSVVILPLIKRLGKIGRETTGVGVTSTRLSIDYFQAAKLIRLSGNDKNVLSIIHDIIWKGNALARKGNILSGLIQPIQETAIILSGVLVLLVGYLGIFEFIAQPLPQLLAFVMVLYRCGGRLAEINLIRARLANAIPNVEYVADFLRKDDKTFQRTTGQTIADDWNAIAVNNVSFHYIQSNEQVIEDVSLRIKRGETIALCGPSGSGKSTLIDLISGLYDPSEGDINMAGVKSVEALPESWFAQFSVVSQDDLILDKTVKENLMFVNPDATMEQIRHACKIAFADGFINEMENQYDTPLGERGLKLSGGQIQRIALARAILKQSPVLILDEATSALDVLSEKRVVDALQQGGEEKTVIMIAHRLSTVVNADRILVMQEGRIVDEGTHDELRQREGVYKKMWDSQALFNG